MSSRTTRKHRRDLKAPHLAGLVLVVGIVFASGGAAKASPATGQDQKTGDQPCAGDVSGYLGVGLGDCRGCVLTVTQESKGWRKVWSFATEPRIAEIAPDSPAAQALQVGDEVVAIDGVLITSAEGGQRFANIEPNRTITIRYRRRGQAVDIVVRAGRRCGLFVEGLRTKGPSSRLRDASFLDDVLSRLAPGMRVQLSQLPRIRIQKDSAQGDITITLPGGLEVGIAHEGVESSVRKRIPFVPEGHLGLRWSCQSCSATNKDGRRVWSFPRPLRVTGIEAGGPADLAGVRIGDQLTAVNGHRIESEKGGEAFSDMQPGQPVQLTLRGPDGRERIVTVVPAARKHGDAPPSSTP